MDRTLIDQYEQGGEKLRRAVVGLTPEEMKQFPVPGTWSIHQIVIHLMDSDLIGTDRMKRLIAEDNPHVIGYNETLFTQRLFYHEQPVEEAVSIFDMNRRIFARVLRMLPDETFERKGTHTEAGEIRLGAQVKKYNEHLDHHLKFIHQKRAKMGKEMW